MGLAQLDLPDPQDVMEYPGPGASAPAADELLSQMAGEEIDRLLSESDVEMDVPAAPAPRVKEAQVQSSAAKAIAPIEPTQREMPPLLATSADASPLDRPDTTRSRATDFSNALATPPAAGASVFAAVAQSVSQTIAGAVPAGGAPVTAASAPPAAAPTAPESITQAAISAVEADRFAGTQEMGLLSDLPPVGGPADVRTASASAIDPELLAELDAAVERGVLTAPMTAADDTARKSRGIPWYIRLLEWINSPLDAYPESVREIIGKIAVVTGVNAIAVLIYVLCFRHG